jgi:hypothetical protein
MDASVHGNFFEKVQALAIDNAMPREPKRYQRLPGRGTSIVHYIRLYQGLDHLLQVSSTGYSELYKRFYFRDIQAITIRKTGWGNVWTVVFGVLMVVFLLFGFDSSGNGRIVLWSIAGFFLTCMIVHLMLGPACVCHIRTAVQTERLPTLRRVKAARKTIHRIKPFIVEAQGQLSREELMRRMQSTRGTGFERPLPDRLQEKIDAPPFIAPDSNPPAASA